jgi:hypothetical protein
MRAVQRMYRRQPEPWPLGFILLEAEKGRFAAETSPIKSADSWWVASASNDAGEGCQRGGGVVGWKRRVKNRKNE